MTDKEHCKVTASLARAVAVAAYVDPRTLGRYLSGDRVAPLCAQRIERALKETGLGHLVAATSQPPTDDAA